MLFILKDGQNKSESWLETNLKHVQKSKNLGHMKV